MHWYMPTSNIDWDAVWLVVIRDLPPLEPALRALAATLEQGRHSTDPPSPNEYPLRGTSLRRNTYYSAQWTFPQCEHRARVVEDEVLGDCRKLSYRMAQD